MEPLILVVGMAVLVVAAVLRAIRKQGEASAKSSSSDGLSELHASLTHKLDQRMKAAAEAATAMGAERGGAHPDAFSAWISDVTDCQSKLAARPLPSPATAAAKPPSPRLVRSAREAEEDAAVWVRFLGWADAKTTQQAGDGGFDVYSTSRGGLGVQVKMEYKPVGRPALQQLLGACKGANLSTPMFFSVSGFTSEAIIWANLVGMELFSFGRDGSISPQNPAAAARVALVSQTSAAKTNASGPGKNAVQPRILRTEEVHYARSLALQDFLRIILEGTHRETPSLLRRLDSGIAMGSLTIGELGDVKASLKNVLRGRCWGREVPWRIRLHRNDALSKSDPIGL